MESPRFRFSIRTVLVVVALCALILAYWARAVQSERAARLAELVAYQQALAARSQALAKSALKPAQGPAAPANGPARVHATRGGAGQADDKTGP